MQDEHDLRVFRLCALWFANASDAQVNTIIKVSCIHYVLVHIHVNKRYRRKEERNKQGHTNNKAKQYNKLFSVHCVL